MPYLLNALFIPVLERNYLVGAFSGVFNLFPSLHLLLLQQGDSVSEKLSISFNSTTKLNYTTLTLSCVASFLLMWQLVHHYKPVPHRYHVFEESFHGLCRYSSVTD